jgi:inner membrane protein
VVDWSRAQVVMGFSDLRGAKADVVAQVAGPSGERRVAFSPSGDLGLGGPSRPAPSRGYVETTSGSFGLVAAPAGDLAASGGRVRATLRFTGAQRISILPFAKSTRVSITGAGGSPKFDGGFLPERSTLRDSGFEASWSVPFVARGLADHGPTGQVSLSALGDKDLGVTFVRTNNPYQNVIRALKYAVMFVGLVFLTFFVFEALSGARLHPAQYLLIGLAQMVFYLLLLSLSEYIGFDLAFALAAVLTVGLIGLYAGAAFRSRARALQALGVFGVVYALIYGLMRLEDFALLAGSMASFIGLAAVMYLTRNIEWYGTRAEDPPTQPAPT